MQAVVVEYVAYAEPVPSDLIVKKYELGIKSATVRNEMAEITELGFLEQPHTSAGRIPSDSGYRYYVDRLLVKDPLASDTQQKVLELTSEEQTLRDLVTQTTRFLSQVSGQFAAAETIRDADVMVRNVVLTALGPDRALLILILHNGLTENRFLDLPGQAILDDIGEANALLERYAAGKRLGTLTKFKTPPTSNARVSAIMEGAAKLIRSIAAELTKGQVVTAGEEHIFSQPEFRASAEALKTLVSSLNDESLRDALAGPSVTVPEIKIGREHPVARLAPFAVIRQTFFVGDTEAGTVALIGPTRMDYQSTIPLVDFTAKAISQTLTKLFG